MPKKSKSTTAEKNISLLDMRNLNGSLSKTAINKIQTEFITAIKGKKRTEANIKEALKANSKLLRANGVGVYVSKTGKKRIYAYDLYSNKELKKFRKATLVADNYTNYTFSTIDGRVKMLNRAEKKLKKSIDTGRAKIARPDNTSRYKVGVGGIKTEMTFRIKDLDNEYVDNIEKNLRRNLKYNLSRYPNQRFNAFVSNKANPFMDRYAFGSGRISLKTIDEAVDILIGRIMDALEKYEEDDERVNGLKTIGLSIYTAPNNISGAGGHKTIQQANNIWFSYDTYSKTNCFWRSVAFTRIMKRINDGELEVGLLEDEKDLNHKLSMISRDLKRNMTTFDSNTTRKLTTEADIQNWVNYRAGVGRTGKGLKIYSRVVIWNEVYKKIKEFTPAGVDGGKITEVYEIQLYNGHFIPLIRWWNLENVKDECKLLLTAQLVRLKKSEFANEKIESRAKWEIDNYDKFFNWIRQGDWSIKRSKKVVLNGCGIRLKDGYTQKEWDKGSTFLTKTFRRQLEFKYIRSQLKLKNPNVRKQIDKIDNRIAAYDFEATANDVDGNEFKVFRTSMAYNDLDNEGDIIKREIDTISTKTFGGENSISKWLDYVSDNIGKFHDYTFYAHNGGKFDLLLILNEYILDNNTNWSISPEFLIVLNGAYLNMILVHKDSTPDNPLTITFKDSLKLLPQGLGKLTEEFDVAHKKIGEVVNHDDVNIKNCFGGKVDTDPKTFFSNEKFKIELSQKVYCNYDCIGLLEMLNDFNDTIYNRCGFSITGCITGATLAKNNFLNNYYDGDTAPIYNMCDKYDRLCRDGYYGGRNESLFIGREKKKLYYFDFTSLYPHTARFRVPYGRPYELHSEDIENLNKRGKEKGWEEALKNNFPLGMIRVKMKTTDTTKLPLHGIKRDGKLLFPNYENWTENTLWTSEMVYGASLNMYDYEILGAVCFAPPDRNYGGDLEKQDRGIWSMRKDEKEDFWSSPNGVLKDFFEDAFRGKADAKREGKLALAFAEKIIANSGYGFWGINVNGRDGEGRDGLEIIPEDDETIWNLIKREEVVNVNKKGNYNIIRTCKKLEVKNFNVAIAAAICAEARMLLHKLLSAVREEGGNIYYMDTDSCIIDIPLNKRLIEEFDWDIENECRSFGEDLGTLKNECVEKLEKYFKKRIEKGDFMMPFDNNKLRYYNKAETKAKVKELVKIEIDANDGELYFDKGIFGGCKQYCLHKTLIYKEPNGKNGEVIANAFKGCKRSLDYSDYEHLIFGTKIEEQRKIEEEIKSRNPNFKAPEGYRLYEKQSQFRSSIITHIADNGTGAYTPIQRVDVDKSFRINYLKGTIEIDGVNKKLDGIDGSGFITPIKL